MIRISRILFVLFAMVFLASCTSNEVIEKKSLIDPKSFIEERTEGIDRSVALGPKVAVDLELEKKIRNNERRQINKEERKNYINISDANNNVFPITINFENVSIQDMAVMFSEITGKNILVGDEVDGKVTAKLVNVPWDKALDSVLKTKKLAKHVDEKANIIRIHKQDVLVAQEEFDRKRITDLQKTIEAQRAIEPIYTEIFRLYYTKAADVKSEIQSVMGSSSGEGAGTDTTKQVQVTIDERLNSLIIQATKSEIDLIARLIKEVDIRTKQVLIEAFIVEATDDFSKELGAKFGIDATDVGHKWTSGTNDQLTSISAAGVAGSQAETGGALTLGDTTGLMSNNGVTGALGGIGFILNTSSAALKFELSASEKDGVTKVLSNPRVFTLDNEEAVIIQGEEIPYKTEAEGGGTDIEFKEAGVKLTVTPSIVGDGNIILNVKIEKKTAKTSDANPPIITREITTKLLIKDSTIVVIGGVFTQETVDSTNKVPFFGDLPLVGSLFRYDKDSDVRKELLVFLAPRVI
ncbi:MAG: type IV pilus secretin PilQ [Candidatus Thioglobus sp.]|jgi:type IV pilus assembly protein PilQ|nr:type IV pilus secretin PilQ [Candidatus Thioglobus sp.]MBT6966280.1 type IV pilus secretin PilQ [Candidatus Thioglobus sp.]